MPENPTNAVPSTLAPAVAVPQVDTPAESAGMDAIVAEIEGIPDPGHKARWQKHSSTRTSW